MSSNDEPKVRIGTANQMERARIALTEDEDFRFQKVKLNKGEKPRFEIAAPTNEDPDAILTPKTITCVVALARKNFYQSEDDKKADKPAKEKRALYIIRDEKILPDVLYVSPTSLKVWQKFVYDMKLKERAYHEVLVEIGGEHVKSKTTGFDWNKLTFKEIRPLTAEEHTQVQAIAELVLAKVKVYESSDEYAAAEEEAINGPAATERDEDESQEHRSATARERIEAADEDEADKSKDKATKDKATKTKPDMPALPPDEEEEPL